MVKVGIADDHPVILEGIKNMLSRHGEFDVLEIWQNGEQLLNGLKELSPDVLLLDIQMPGQSGIELAEIISKKYKKIKIIALTSMELPSQVKKMLQFSKGYLLKDSDENTIVSAIKAVYANKEFLDERIKEKLVADMFKSNRSIKDVPLSRREKEILKLVVQGLTASQIAEQLFLSTRTVENHRNNILQKLQVKNTAEMVKTAIENGLAD